MYLKDDLFSGFCFVGEGILKSLELDDNFVGYGEEEWKVFLGDLFWCWC